MDHGFFGEQGGYLINFSTMQQTNIASHGSRSIRRIPSATPFHVGGLAGLLGSPFGFGGQVYNPFGGQAASVAYIKCDRKTSKELRDALHLYKEREVAGAPVTEIRF